MHTLLETVLSTTLWGLWSYLLVISLYIALVTFGAWCLVLKERVHRSKTTSRPTIAILVPAHNEELGIATTVQQLLGAEYPRESFRVIVIADNCTDRTAEVARAAGADVIERTDLVKRGKGQALDWVLKEHEQLLSRFDLVAFVDADMYVDPKFLAALAEKFADPQIQVVQGRYTIANPGASWLTALGFVSFAYVNHVRPAGRTFWGGTAELKGSGMCFRRELICETGWPSGSIAEDVDFGKELLFRDICVHYAPRAIVTSDIPTRLRQVEVQQSRWEGGKLDVERKFFGRTLRALMRRPSIAMLDALLDLCVPPLSVVVLLSVLGFALAFLVDAPSPWLFLIPLAAFALSVVTGLVQLRPPFKTYVYLACAPAFILWKLTLLARLMRRPGQAEWRRTPRDAEQK